MTQEELAVALVNARADLLKARRDRDNAQRGKQDSESAKDKLSASFDAMIPMRVDSIATGVTAKACADGAIRFAKAVATWQAAETALVTAQASLDACTTAADNALAALIVVCQPTG